MMRTIKKLSLSAIVLVVAASAGAVIADDSDVREWRPSSAGNDVTNLSSLQRGAKYYMNYCLGCHSLEFKRYQRIADDLQLPDDVALENIVFTGEELADMVKIAMPEDDASEWFGMAAPDLTLVARSRGPDWIYNFLHSFYVDEGTVAGTNNRMLGNAAMPHVLWSLQGLQEAVYKESDNGSETFVGFRTVREGRLSHSEYDRVVRDIVNFLDYAGEPIQTQRRQMGFWVLAFIGVFILLAYLLKKEYWRDVK
ncbi:cytochrome c1 [Natronospira bacteriovora]|uniref:Cytochrome c1 n=1 Tax=Natronospira bacteriovora TaxID=3069753 RepID=A0ABU0W6G0_9GAMM|nr:cytochrome c1 [Natronospira sp. AB-CW4]MDQ2069524.1 cytochrome c1 [Natronospira sp. AB-CW4]